MCVMTQCWYAGWNSFISDDVITRERRNKHTRAGSRSTRSTQASQLAVNHVNTHASRPHTRVNYEHAHTHTHSQTHRHTHSHTSTTKVFGGMSSSSNGVDRCGFVVAPASQYSVLTLLHNTGRRAEKVLRDGNRTKRHSTDVIVHGGVQQSGTKQASWSSQKVACSQGIRRRASRYDSNNNEPPLARRRQSGR